MTTTAQSALTDQNHNEAIHLTRNGTVKKTGNPVIHQLEISKDELIPRNCKNSHCLQTGLRAGRLILVGETNDKKRWIICVQSRTKNIFPATVHLQINGISEDRNETATSIKIMDMRRCESLFDLLDEMKSPELALEEVNDERGNLMAFYIK